MTTKRKVKQSIEKNKNMTSGTTMVNKRKARKTAKRKTNKKPMGNIFNSLLGGVDAGSGMIDSYIKGDYIDLFKKLFIGSQLLTNEYNKKKINK